MPGPARDTGQMGISPQEALVSHPFSSGQSETSVWPEKHFRSLEKREHGRCTPRWKVYDSL